MAIYLNNDGYWIDTDKEEPKLPGYYDDLIRTKPRTAAELQEGVAEQAASNLRISNYQNEMTALSATASGQDLLVDLFSNPDADIEQRAGAASALYAGVDVSIGNNGEMSFKAKGGTLGFDYPDKVTAAQQSNAARNQRAAGIDTPVNLIEGLDKSIAQIQAMDNPTDIMKLFAELQSQAVVYKDGVTSDFKASNGAKYGLPMMERSLAESRILDQQYLAANNLPAASGDSTETQNIVRSLATARTMLDADMADMLSNHPEMAAIQTRMKVLDSIVSTKLNQTTITPENLPSGISAVYDFLGTPEAPATPMQIMEFNTLAAKRDPVAMDMINSVNETPATVFLKAINSQPSDKMFYEKVFSAAAGADDTFKVLEDAFRSFDDSVAKGQITPTKEQEEVIKKATLQSAKLDKQGYPQVLAEANATKFGLVLDQVRQLRDAAWMDEMISGARIPTGDESVAAAWQQAVKDNIAQRESAAVSAIPKPSRFAKSAEIAVYEANVADAKRTANTSHRIGIDTLIKDTFADYSSQKGSNEVTEELVNPLAEFLYISAKDAPGSAIFGGISGLSDKAAARNYVTAILLSHKRSTTADRFRSGFGMYN